MPNWVQMSTMVAAGGSDVGRGCVSLFGGAGAEIASSCPSCAPPSFKYPPRQLLYYALARPRSVTELSPEPPTAPPRGRGCRGPRPARREPIGAPAMIARMLQPPSPSGDLLPEFLKAGAEQTVTTQYTESFFFFFFFFRRQNRTEQNNQTTSRQTLAR